MAAFGPPHGMATKQEFQLAGETSISLNNVETVKFIQLYQREELLWNVNLPEHVNKPKRLEALRRISDQMGKNWSEQQVKGKILSLRSRYSKEIVKVRVSIASGADAYTPVWRFFPMLDSFLRPFSTTRKTDTPVMRAFHKRLMEGRGHSFSSSPSTVHPATGPYFHPGDPSVAADDSFHGSQQNASLPASYYLDDDDDDVQIVEEYMVGLAQEDEVYVDDDGDDDEGSSSCGNLDFQVNGAECSSTVDDQGHASDEQGNTGHLSDNYYENIYASKQQSVTRKSPNQTSSKSPAAERIENQTLLHKDSTAAAQDDSSSAADSHANAALRSGDSGNQPAGQGSEFTRIQVKQEKPTSPPSPPPPPLPPRQFGPSSENSHSSYRSTELLPKEDSVTQSSVTVFGKQNDEYNNVLSSSSTTIEPRTKRMKLEKEPNVGDNMKQMNSDSSARTKSAATITVDNTDTFRMNTVNPARRISSSTTQMPGDLIRISKTQKAKAAQPNQAEDGTTVVAGQMPDQLTNAMTHQMTNLMQTLVTNLVERTSASATSDAELAFANHVVCELRKLDEDLRADVKFSIQKAIYEAQKEMRQRRVPQSGTDTRDSAELGTT